MYDFEQMDKRLLIYANTFLVANKLQAATDAELEVITAKQWLMIIILGAFDEPPTLMQLAKMCGSSHQNTKQIALKLNEKGYVKLLKDEKDGRVMRIYKTEKVEELSQRFEEPSKLFINELFSDLTAEEIDVMSRALFILSDRLDKMNRSRKR